MDDTLEAIQTHNKKNPEIQCYSLDFLICSVSQLKDI